MSKQNKKGIQLSITWKVPLVQLVIWKLDMIFSNCKVLLKNSMDRGGFKWKDCIHNRELCIFEGSLE